jgi:predicted HTH transcriptional regulator
MHHVSAAELITTPEGKTLEFKQDTSSSKNLMKTLVAFANSAGGTIVIGVEDRTRTVLGVDNPLDEEERLCNLIADSIEPRLVPNVELLALGDKTLLAVKVYPSGTRPHWIKREGPELGVFVRLGSTNRLADEALIGELRRGALGIGFDEQAVQEGSLEDLDFTAAAKAFEGHRTLGEKDLESIRLVTRSQGRLVPTFGGILLFGRKREEQFPDAWIQCGRFAGKDKSVIVDHIDIHDHLPIAVERGLEFLKKHALRGADLSELKRKDTWSIPW